MQLMALLIAKFHYEFKSLWLQTFSLKSICFKKDHIISKPQSELNSRYLNKIFHVLFI